MERGCLAAEVEMSWCGHPASQQNVEDHCELQAKINLDASLSPGEEDWKSDTFAPHSHQGHGIWDLEVSMSS